MKNAIQDSRAKAFIRRIDRKIDMVERHNGYDLKKSGSTRVGYVRYNIGGQNRGLYQVYVYGDFSDPQQRFVNEQASGNRGSHCLVNPDDENAMRYAVSVLESSYDQK